MTTPAGLSPPIAVVCLHASVFSEKSSCRRPSLRKKAPPSSPPLHRESSSSSSITLSSTRKQMSRGHRHTLGGVVTSVAVAPHLVAESRCCGRRRRPPQLVGALPWREEGRSGRCRAFPVARGRCGGAHPPPLPHRGGVVATVAAKKKKKGGREAMVARWASGQAGRVAGFTCYPRRPTSPSAPSFSPRSRRRSLGSATTISLEW